MFLGKVRKEEELFKKEELLLEEGAGKEGCLFSHSSSWSSLGALGPVSILCVLGSKAMIGFIEGGGFDEDGEDFEPPGI